MFKAIMGVLIIGILWYLFSVMRDIWKKEDRQKDLSKEHEDALEDLADVKAESTVMDVKEEIQTRESKLDKRIEKFNNKV